jgi:hypothetical protein
VSNVLITFITTPRGDSKRFEMLQLIASILSWTDDQREKVGLQRASGALSSSSVISSGRAGARGHARSGKGKAVEDEGVENEVSSQSRPEDLGTTPQLTFLFIVFLEPVDRVPAQRSRSRRRQHGRWPSSRLPFQQRTDLSAPLGERQSVRSTDARLAAALDRLNDTATEFDEPFLLVERRRRVVSTDEQRNAEYQGGRGIVVQPTGLC